MKERYKLKDIQEIMMEMEKINEQVAAEVNDEEKETSTEEELKNLVDPTHIQPSGGIDSGCDSVDRYVSFSCCISIPDKFDVFDKAKITYDTSCLQCIVEPCCEEVTIGNGGGGRSHRTTKVPRFAVKIVGCIPFIINVPVETNDKCTKQSYSYGYDDTAVKSDSNADITEQSDRHYNITSSICCHDSVCVDNIICVKCQEKDAIIACNNIHLNCYKVEVKDFQAQKYNDCVKVSGKFKLPTC